MTPEQDALKRVVGFLIDPDPEAVAKLANSLSSAGFYVDAAAATLRAGGAGRRDQGGPGDG